MSRWLNRMIAFLIAAVTALYAAFLILDLFFPQYGAASIQIKLAGVAIALALSLAAHAQAGDERDGRLVVAALSLTMASDAILLLTDSYALGIACFCLVHLVYITRYRASAVGPFAWVAGAVIAFCGVGWAVGTAVGWALPYRYILGGLYAALILAASFLAFRAPLPRINRFLARAGMILFLLCDANVALRNLLPRDAPLIGIVSIAVWAFYLPAQVLLSISAYGFAERRIS